MKYDATIVGAGPAGSTTAKFLAEKGFKVALIDKYKFPRDKPCGGGLPYRVLNSYKYIEEKNLVESYTYSGFAYSPSMKYKAKMITKEPIVGMVLRKKFDAGLVKLAVDSGAELLEGKTVEDVKILKNNARIKFNDKTSLDSQIVVGADGVWSTVAKKLNLMSKKREYCMCVYNEYSIDENTMDQFYGNMRICHMHLKFKGLYGYGWVFPKKKHLNIGVGRLFPIEKIPEKKRNLLDVYKEYFNTLKEMKIIPETLEIGHCSGGALPFGPLEKTYGNRVLLVGDAAGFTNPLTGEGIYYAMRSGEIAAKVINESLSNGDTSEQFLSKYREL